MLELALRSRARVRRWSAAEIRRIRAKTSSWRSRVYHMPQSREGTAGRCTAPSTSRDVSRGPCVLQLDVRLQSRPPRAKLVPELITSPSQCWPPVTSSPRATKLRRSGRCSTATSPPSPSVRRIAKSRETELVCARAPREHGGAVPSVTAAPSDSCVGRHRFPGCPDGVDDLHRRLVSRQCRPSSSIDLHRRLAARLTGPLPRSSRPSTAARTGRPSTLPARW